MVQEAFIRAWKTAPDWRDDAPFGAWLGRVTANLCLDRLRKPRHDAIDETDEAALPAGDQAQEAEAADLGRRVAEAVARLPDRQRAALTLCALEGYTAAEAAEAMGATEGGVESLLVRARRRLKTELKAVAAATFGRG